MSRIASRGPLGLKEQKAKKKPGYLSRVRSLPCCICEEFGLQQLSRTTAHHTIMGRYQNTKTPDHEAIPLCDGHHQGNFDTSKVAVHREPAKWSQLYGRDTEWTSWTQRRIGYEPQE